MKIKRKPNKKMYGDDWEITYDTPITDDVICFVENVESILEAVKGLIND